MPGTPPRLIMCAPLALVASLAACGTATEPLPRPSAGVTFKLKNDTGAPIFVRRASYSPYNHWTSLSDSDGRIVERLPPYCDGECGARPNCADNQPPTIIELGPGQETTEPWDGSAYVPSPTSSCYQPTRLGAGRYQVSFCYGYGRNGLALERTTCVARTFDFVDGNVITEVVAEPQPQPVRFVLENNGVAPLWVMNNLACSSAPGWISLTDAQGAALSIYEGTCGCQCGRPCAPCAAACVAPQAVQVLPGQSVEHVWDGFYNATIADQSCSERRIAPDAPLTASFCFGDTEPARFESIPNPTCRQITFHPRLDRDVVADVR